MITHIMTNAKYCLNFINFIEKNFNGKNHRYLFFCSPPEPSHHRYQHYKIFMKKVSTETKDRLLYVDSLKNYYKAIKILKESDKVILHGFGAVKLFYFPLYYTCIKKSSWIMWGWDLYHYRFKKKYRLINFSWFLRDILLNRLSEIITFIKDEYFLATKMYNINTGYKFAFYLNPVTFEMLDKVKENNYDEIKKDYVKILVGNSASPSNNHIEIFEKLVRFKYKDMCLIVPLSYGDVNYAEKVKKAGYELFGKKFCPLTQKLTPQKYSELLSSVDVCIMNHDRQQGMGNIRALLYLGKKVYIKSGLPHHKFLLNKGLIVFDTRKISNQSYQDLIQMDLKDRIKNQRIIEEIFGKKSCVESWKKVFER